ncbi:transposase zinc-binding domain-containing protein [Escherichia coli]|uniref:transposase zinc-binding domain-containing protein n=1 Tax=Escherichia coli TaxID=562 RepID=UPI0039C8668C
MTRSGGDFQPRPLKRLFTANQCWTSFPMRAACAISRLRAVTKCHSCGTRILGVKEYNCDKPECPHVRYVTNSCGSRACPSCGKRPQTCG